MFLSFLDISIMNQAVWCFLVSANKEFDYRTVVAPDFMCAQNDTFILAQAAGGKITDKGTACYRRIINSKVGSLTLVFRIIKALETDIGISGDGILKDSFGRVIRLIEGIVFQGNFSETDIVITSEDFDGVHKQIIEHYQKFWPETKPIPAYATQLFYFSEKENKDNGFQLIKLEDYIVGGKPKKDAKPETKTPSQTNNKYSGNSFQCWQPTTLLSRSKLGINFIGVSLDGKEITVQYDDQKTIEVFQLKQDKLSKKRELHIENAINQSSPDFLTGFFKNGGDTVSILNPDGDQIITGDKNGNIRVWYTDGGGEITTQPAPKHDTQIRCMAVDKKNNILASGDQKGNIKIWELGSGGLTEKTTIVASERPINSLGFSPNGKMLASGDDGNKIKLWNAKTVRPNNHYDIKHPAVKSVASSSDGKLIASGDSNGKIKIWSLKSQTAISSICKEHTRAVTSVVFTPDSKLISGGKDGKLIMWEMGAN
ncbi:MAG: hypothetical protein O4965_13930 [Trichodesmium sp. St19_bin1]|nr:hypothetical protein [Trichodesmium sp. St19_bin1]